MLTYNAGTVGTAGTDELVESSNVEASFLFFDILVVGASDFRVDWRFSQRLSVNFLNPA